MSSIKVDSTKLEELSASLKRLGGTVEDREKYINSIITELIRDVRRQYSEQRDVQLALNQVEEDLREVRLLADKVTQGLAAKSTALIRASGQYQAEEKATQGMIGQNKPPSSYYTSGGGLAGEGLNSYLMDKLFEDPVVQELHLKAMNGTEEERQEAKKKLDEIFKARDTIARAQVAHATYKSFGNSHLMEMAHKEAMRQRDILKGYGINEELYKKGINLSHLYTGTALQACSYDPSIQLTKDGKPITVLMAQDNQYKYLLGLVLKGSSNGAWARKQLDEIHKLLSEIGRAQVAWNEYKAKDMKKEMDGAHIYAEKLRTELKNKYSLSSEMVDGVDFKYMWTGTGVAGKYLSESESIPTNSNTKLEPQMNQLLSRQSIDMILKFEVTSKEYYIQHYQHPILPGESSGITIGIGYDLGQVSLAEFKRDWGDKLSTSDIELLSQCIGKHLKDGDNANNKKMKDLLAAVSKVTISLDKAESVYLNKTLPKFVELAKKTFPNFDKLPENAQGALVSLVINRGGGLDRTNNRRKEMVEISDFMKNKTVFSQSDLNYIASKITEMKRLWPNTKGLQVRRDIEADFLKNALNSNENSTITPPSYNPPDKSTNTLDGSRNNLKVEPVNQINLNKKGCAVASFVMVANFFGAKTDFRTVESKFVGKGYMLDFSKAAKAYGLKYSDKRGLNEAEVLALARKSLDKGEPVLIQIYGNGVTHFVVAIGYKGDGKAAKDFTIVDPWGGVEKTLDKASRYNEAPVTSIRFITKEGK